MKYCILVPLIFSLGLQAFGQIGIIQDPDGYTNVRSSANSQSEVIYQVQANQVFLYDPQEIVDGSKWIYIYIPKNRYSLGCTEIREIEGFIHISRLLPIEQLPKASNQDLSFRYELSPFQAKDHIIDYADENMVGAIDGQWPWGVDGNMPTIGIKDIQIRLDGKSIAISPALFGDIFQLGGQVEIYKNGGTYFVHQGNSDGAGYYELVWVIDDSGVQQRLVGSIF